MTDTDQALAAARRLIVATEPNEKYPELRTPWSSDVLTVARAYEQLVDRLERMAYAPSSQGLTCRFCHARDSGLSPRGRDTYKVNHYDTCVLAAQQQPQSAEDAPAAPDNLYGLPPATDETICTRCGEHGHYWCRPTRIRFLGRGVPGIYPDDLEYPEDAPDREDV